jgi:hypothetical protein
MSVTIYTTTQPNALEELNFKYHSAREPEHVEAEYASCSVFALVEVCDAKHGERNVRAL